MSEMFVHCDNLGDIDLSNFNTSNVTSMIRMFANCYSLGSLDLSNFDTNNVAGITGMFYECVALTSLDLSGFCTRNITDMSNMFYNCSGLTSLDLSNFDTSNVASMWRTFYGCSSLISLDLSSFDTSNVVNMSYMFKDCYNLPTLDISSFDTSNVTNMDYMFNSCSKLTTIFISNLWSVDTVENSSYMFYGCRSLVGQSGTTYNSSYTNKDRANYANGYLTRWNPIELTVDNQCSNRVAVELPSVINGGFTTIELRPVDNDNVIVSFKLNGETVIGDAFIAPEESGTVIISDVRMFAVDNQCPELVTIDLPECVEPGVTQLTLNVLNTNGLLHSFKLNGEDVIGDTFIVPEESEVAIISDIKFFTVDNQCPDLIAVELPTSIKPGVTQIALIALNANKMVDSFKLNGVDVSGYKFTVPIDTNVATISDVVVVDCVIIESEHNPYSNDLSRNYEHTFEGATLLNVVLDYQTESTNYDYIYVYDAAGNQYGPYGNSTRNNITLTLSGDYIRIYFETDSSVNEYYGFKAIISPVYPDPVELIVDNRCSNLVDIDVPDVVYGGITAITLNPLDTNNLIHSFKMNGENVIGNTFVAPEESGTIIISEVQFFAIDNQCPDLVNIETPASIDPGVTEITLTAIDPSNIVHSFKLNGKEVLGNVFTISVESAIAVISEVKFFAIDNQCADLVTINTPEAIEPGMTTIVLTAIEENKVITSFKLNGVELSGDKFTVPTDNNVAVISDVVIIDCVVIESEHNPYPNDLSKNYEHTFDGATSLTVILEYQTESTSYDYIYVYDANGNQFGKYGDTTRRVTTFTLSGDYIKIYFKTDGSVNEYYGFKATIVPVYPDPIELTVHNQCSNLVTIDVPDTVFGGTTVFTLNSLDANNLIYSFKLNGEEILGNTFVSPEESGTVIISDVKFFTIDNQCPDLVTVSAPTAIEPGVTEVALTTINANQTIVSFKLNGVDVDGNKFTVPVDNNVVVISDVVTANYVIIESEHSPYQNNLSKNYERIFDGAISLTVVLEYQTEDTEYDYIYVYDHENNEYGPYGGEDKGSVTITLSGNYINILFETDVSVNEYYGFKATITPNYN
jgi:surface protein